MIDKAHQLAKQYHEGQKYGERDYMYHLRNVYIKCLDHYSNISIEDIRAVGSVAFLHDLLEESVKIRDMKRIKKYTKQLELLCED